MKRYFYSLSIIALCLCGFGCTSVPNKEPSSNAVQNTNRQPTASEKSLPFQEHRTKRFKVFSINLKTNIGNLICAPEAINANLWASSTRWLAEARAIITSEAPCVEAKANFLQVIQIDDANKKMLFLVSRVVFGLESRDLFAPLQYTFVGPKETIEMTCQYQALNSYVVFSDNYIKCDSREGTVYFKQD